jgi:hypothetical protein
VQRVANLRLERLCGHHQIAGFACGESDLDKLLEVFHERFREGADVLAYVLVDDGDDAVVGYIAISTMQYEAGDTGERIDYFVIPAMALAAGYRGRDNFDRLRLEAEDAIDVRRLFEREIDYKGIVVLPYTNSRLPHALEFFGFIPFEGNSQLMWKPFDD